MAGCPGWRALGAAPRDLRARATRDLRARLQQRCRRRRGAGLEAGALAPLADPAVQFEQEVRVIVGRHEASRGGRRLPDAPRAAQQVLRTRPVRAAGGIPRVAPGPDTQFPVMSSQSWCIRASRRPSSSQPAAPNTQKAMTTISQVCLDGRSKWCFGVVAMSITHGTTKPTVSRAKKTQSTNMDAA